MSAAIEWTRQLPVGDWRALAACRDVDPDLFFPVAESGPVFDEQVVEAKAVCASCPVRQQCLEFARDALSDGIAGGLTAQERRELPTSASGLRFQRRDVSPATASTAELAEAGRAAIRAGQLVREVAREFGVTVRTAQRWATQIANEAAAQRDVRGVA
ncbi:WhiB family transcriptional regulator [Pseudonocardia sp. GCM10023141]|uniref:WhiB family transcriptional regulator n=1 Tax=Pseudonocardia sp. GCM10023141 TaxID=3252653 RepID=UPI0036172210